MTTILTVTIMFTQEGTVTYTATTWKETAVIVQHPMTTVIGIPTATSVGII